MRHNLRRPIAIMGAALVGAVALAACGSSGGSGGSAGGASAAPIVLGAVSSLTGPVPFPEVPGAAKAVFDKVNAAGGINGHQIQYIVQDDKGDPTSAAAAARLLVDEKNAVAMVGGASLVECSANAAYYAKSNVKVVSGTGVDPACFSSANISPVNTGPFEGYTALLYYASETLKKQKICAIIQGLPGLTEGYQAAEKRWEKITGKTPAIVDTSVTFGQDPTPAILATKNAGCDAAVFNSIEPTTISFMKIVKQQGLLDKVAWVTLASSYTDGTIKALKQQDTLGLYANAEFTPYTSDSPDLKEWHDSLTAAGVPLTSLSQGGYVSAKIMVDVLKGIQGDITAESVSAALAKLKDTQAPMMGVPYSFGDGTAHNPNHASKFVQATADGWTVTTPDWIKLPA